MGLSACCCGFLHILSPGLHRLEAHELCLISSGEARSCCASAASVDPEMIGQPPWVCPCRRIQESRSARIGRIGLSWVNKVMPPPTIASLSGAVLPLNRRPWHSVLQARSSAVDGSQYVSARATEISTKCFSRWTPYLAALSATQGSSSPAGPS